MARYLVKFGVESDDPVEPVVARTKSILGYWLRDRGFVVLVAADCCLDAMKAVVRCWPHAGLSWFSIQCRGVNWVPNLKLYPCPSWSPLCGVRPRDNVVARYVKLAKERVR